MKKARLRILSGIGIFIVIIGLTTAGTLIKYQEIKMEPLQTEEIVPDIYSVNNAFVNMFLIRDNDSFVAIDAGNDMNAISVELQKLKIDPNKVEAILLTHTHHDHTAAINLFKNARIYLSGNELEATGGKKPALLTLGKNSYSNPFSLLNDQQIIRFKKINVQVIFTPGHTPGSTCYLVNSQCLFVGDAFSLNKGKIDKPNASYTKNMKSAVHSLIKISNLPTTNYIFTAHTGYSSNYKNALADWKKIKE